MQLPFKQIIKKVGKLFRDVTTLANPSNWLLAGLGMTSKSNVVVNDRSVLGLSAMMQGVRIIAESIASLPIGYYQIDELENSTRKRSHYLDRLLRKPADYLTSYQFRLNMTGLAVLYGNAYALIFRDEATGRAKSLKILKPGMCQVFKSGGEVYYRIWGIGDVSYLDVIHIRGIGILTHVLNDEAEVGLQGENPLQLGKDSFGVAIAAQDYESSAMKNGGNVSGILKFPHQLDEVGVDEIEETFTRKYYGSGNQNRVMVLGGGMEFERVALSPQESMLLESRKFSVEEIARWLNIPLYKLGHLDRATFNNIEQLSRDFYQQTVLPWSENWTQELNLKLSAEVEKDTHCFKFDFSNFLRADSQALGEMIAKLFNVGIISIDDGRRMVGLNQVGEDWSKKHWVQLNLAPADREYVEQALKQQERKVGFRMDDTDKAFLNKLKNQRNEG